MALNPAHECAYCHDVHGAVGVALLAESEVEVLCLSCHTPGGHPDAPAADVHTNADVDSDYAPFRATCLRCHNPHADPDNWLGEHEHPDGSVWPGVNIKLVGVPDADGLAVIETLEWDGAYVDGRRYVVFEQLGSKTGTDAEKIHSFSDEDLDANGVKDGPCEVCHSQTDYHCNGDADNTGLCGELHHTGEPCTQCHGHDASFMPPSGVTTQGQGQR
jgi:predicted CXXCH cytochrome family protein